MTKQTATKSSSAKDSTSKTSSKSSATGDKKTKSSNAFKFTNPAGNMFDSDFVDDIKQNFEKVVNTSNTNMCGNMDCLSENQKMVQKLIGEFGRQTSDLLNQQMQLGVKTLSCRTAADFVDLAQTSFKNNYDHAMRFNSNMFDLFKKCQMNNLKHTKQCMEGSSKSK